MENIIRSFIEGPLPNILVISGVVFLFLSVVGKIGAKIAVDPHKQRYAGVLGVILLLAGLSLHLMALAILTESPPAVEPTVKPPITDTDTINNEVKNQIRDIDIQLDELDKELASIPPTPGPLHELLDIIREPEKRLENIENVQTELRAEVEQLRLSATEEPDAKRRIEQIEGETIPDLEVEKKAVQRELQELHDMIRNAEIKDELEGRIDELMKKKQSLQDHLTR